MRLNVSSFFALRNTAGRFPRLYTAIQYVSAPNPLKMDVGNSTNFTQPAECYYSRDAFPSMGNLKDYSAVPLYQTTNPDKDMYSILEDCCTSGRMWTYSNPEPCTAVCNSTSAKQAQQVQYCLNAEHVDYGGDASGAGREVVEKRTWLLLLGGLIVSGFLM